MKKRLCAVVVFYILVGIAVGILTGYLRGFSPYGPMAFWMFSDLAGRYGFWVFSVSVIAYIAKNEKEAGITDFAYMFAMCIAYYTYLYMHKGILYKKEFVFWTFFAALAAGYAVLLRVAKEKERKRDLVVCVIPLALLGIEFLQMVYFLYSYGTNVFLLVVDFVGVVTTGVLFQRNRTGKSKAIILGGAGIITLAVCGFYLILWSLT
ncbi:MAG: hypothetical protein IKI15_05915 [Lachnospiraceae bacterium]|nr:hypothetical protein [Lachnospiraceae bacterium]